MKNLKTVFEVQPPSILDMRPEAFLMSVVGVFVLIIGPTILIYYWRSGKLRGPKLYGPVFLIGWGLFILLFHSLTLLDSSESPLIEAYRNGECEVLEGVVHVLHKQAKGGHDSGDKITIAGRDIEISYFTNSVAYHDTVFHGGVLTEGVYARVHLFEGKIAKIELKK